MRTLWLPATLTCPAPIIAGWDIHNKHGYAACFTEQYIVMGMEFYFPDQATKPTRFPL